MRDAFSLFGLEFSSCSADGDSESTARPSTLSGFSYLWLFYGQCVLKAIRLREGFRPSFASYLKVKLVAKGGISWRFGHCPPQLFLGQLVGLACPQPVLPAAFLVSSLVDFGRFCLHEKKLVTSIISAYLKFYTAFVDIYRVTPWLYYENVL